MQINGINKNSFGAQLDSSARNWLFTTRIHDRVDTSQLENLFSDNYRDRYIRISDNDDGITDIRIKPAKYPVHGIPDIVIFSSDKGRVLSDIMPTVIANMQKISQERDAWQIKYDSGEIK